MINYLLLKKNFTFLIFILLIIFNFQLIFETIINNDKNDH